MKNRAIAIILMIIGAAFFLGALFFILDNLTATEPVGLVKWVFDVFVALIGAGAGIEGWLGLSKSQKGEPTNRLLTVGDKHLIVIGSDARLVQTDAGAYFEHADKVEIHSPAVIRLKNPHQLPPAPTDFTGREKEITQILNRFENHKGIAIAGLTGMGGIGKTALGLVVAHNIAGQYPDGQIFLDLRGASKEAEPLSPADVMRYVLLSCAPMNSLHDANEAQLAGLYQTLLTEKKVLLFLDNARDAAQIRALIPPAPSAAIITSRQHFSLTEFGFTEPLTLNVLSAEASRTLLRIDSPKLKEATVEELDSLVRICGNLPLALRVVASLLNDRCDWTLDFLIKRLEDEHTRLKRLKRTNDINLDVETSIAVSYDSLPDEIKKCFRIISVFHGGFWNQPLAAIWNTEDQEVIESSIGHLLIRNLLSSFPAQFGQVGTSKMQIMNVYTLHDLHRLFASDRLRENLEESRTIIERHAAYFLFLASIANNEYEQGGEHIANGLSLFHAIWSDLSVTYQRMQPNQEDWPRPNNADQWLMSFPNSCAHLLASQVSTHERIRILQSALGAARAPKSIKTQDVNSGKEVDSNKLKGAYIPIEVAHLISLGDAYNASSNYHDAIQCLEEALSILRPIGYKSELGSKFAKGKIFGNMGTALFGLGDFRKAIEYFDKQLGIAHDFGDNQSEATARGNLGNAFNELKDFHTAIENYKKQLDISRKLGFMRDEALALSNMGAAFSRLGDVHKAMRYHRQAMNIAQTIGDRQIAGSCLNNMGLCYDSLGDLHKAIRTYDEALIIAREFGSRGLEGRILVNLGTAYIKLGEKDRARELWQKALTIFQTIQDPHELITQNTLIKLDMMLTVIEAVRSGDPEAKIYFQELSRIASDSNAPSDIQELAKVLQRILVGVKNPDLSRLSPDFAKLLKKELDYITSC
jgi:tetratricopeptide (TPR) repeat protein